MLHVDLRVCFCLFWDGVSFCNPGLSGTRCEAQADLELLAVLLLLLPKCWDHRLSYSAPLNYGLGPNATLNYRLGPNATLKLLF